MESKSEPQLKLQLQRGTHERKTWVEAEITLGDRVGLVKEDQFIFTQAYTNLPEGFDRGTDFFFFFFLSIIHLITTTTQQNQVGKPCQTFQTTCEKIHTHLTMLLLRTLDK